MAAGIKDAGNEQQDYNLAIIRQLMRAAFSREDLRRCCQDHSLFRPILARFGPSDSLDKMVDMVIDYCQTRVLLEKLLVAVWEENPRQYATFVPPLPPRPSDPDAKGSGDDVGRRPSKPARKGCAHKRVVWSVIAVLAVIVVCLIVICGLIKRIPAPPVVALKTAHNRYVTAMGADWGWVLRAETGSVGTWEKFTVLCQDDGKLALVTFHNRYVTAMGADWGWVLRAETGNEGDCERFAILDADSLDQWPCSKVPGSLRKGDEVSVAFRTCHNRYVTAQGADQDWGLWAETSESKDYEFTLVPAP